MDSHIADRRCSNYISVINNFITYEGASYSTGLTVLSKFSCQIVILLLCKYHLRFLPETVYHVNVNRTWFDFIACRHIYVLCVFLGFFLHYNDVIMSGMAVHFTGVSVVYSILCSCPDQTSKLRISGLCEGNSPVTGERPSKVKNISIGWRHHAPIPFGVALILRFTQSQWIIHDGYW